MIHFRKGPLLFAGAALILAAGCSGTDSVDPAVHAEHRQRLTLAEEPDDAQTVLDVRQEMFGEDASASSTAKLNELPVTLVGSVGGVANPSAQSHPDFPFAKGKAMFFLADPEAVAEVDEHEHHHAPGEECAFCASHAADMAHALAAVQFKDAAGKVLQIDARELFDLKEKETVVVTGVAKVAVGGMITVDATGVYVRR